MDELDRKLIGFLRTNGRMPVAQLADLMGVSRGTVQNRLQKLQADGTILNFTLTLGATPEIAQIRAIMMLAIEGERADRIVSTLKGYPEVAAVHSTNGRWDLVVELATENLQVFDRVLQQIRQIKGVANSETSLLLSTHACARIAPQG
jgi:DNA-binding Lrp family transcriptional regulator